MQGEESQHDRVFLRLKILFAGYEPSGGNYESTVDYFVDNVLFKAYHFVIDLRELLKGYQALKNEQERSGKLQKLQQLTSRGGHRHGVDMSLVQIRALRTQVGVISPYRNKINHAQHGVFNNIDYFMDIASGLRKTHLKKANELLPQVFNNLVNRSNIKELLSRDLTETRENYEQIEREVDKKVNAVEKMTSFYQSFFDNLEQQLLAVQ